jgi:molecular chaperone DnaK
VGSKLIEKNTTIPTSKSQTFSTAADNQTDVTIHIVQGERPMVADNKSLGQFNLGGIAPAPRGVPQIEVTFDIDANGILNVSAKDKATGKSSSIKITASSGLSKEEVERMQKEAELHKAEDEKKKEAVEAKNIAEQMIYTADKSLKDFKDKIPADVTKTIEDKVTALKAVKDGTDAAAIKSATEALSAELQKIGDIVNKAQAAEQPKKEEADPNVRDAEFKEKK